MRPFSLITLLALAALLPVSCARKSEQAATPGGGSATSASSYPHVDPGMLKGWMIGLMNREPSPTAKSAITIGSGEMQVLLPEESKAWQESGDVDSSGTRETITFMWDGQNKVIYAYTRDPIRLSDGSFADQGLMVAQFGEGNKKGRVPGSGWYAYVTSRDSTHADRASGSLYGCSFDRWGAEQECGAGTWAKDENEFQIKAVVDR